MASEDAGTQVFTVDAAGDGRRVDRWLTAGMPDHSRSEIQRWIKEGRITVAGVPVRASTVLVAGDVVSVTRPTVRPAPTLTAQPIPLDIIYEDADLLVINKPAGMVVHPAPGHTDDTLVNAVLHHCPDIAGVGGEVRPGIVHRLDKETSGLIVVAKHDRAHRNLQAQWKTRTVAKTYLALVEGRPEPPAGRIIAPIGRHPTDRKRQAVLTPDPVTGAARGREAVTDYHTVATFHSEPGARGSTYSLMEVVIHTGRTHQIRVHFAWRHHPVVGDTVYGYRRVRLPLTRQFLHAYKLRFALPSTGEEREFVAPLPDDLQHVLDTLEQESP
ncbi:MAG: RluA family pseudouridine synthase [Caldilineaceae bacterium]|nr:RluA family pseudouridine synthase [Caldilineaceae bacterium]